MRSAVNASSAGAGLVQPCKGISSMPSDDDDSKLRLTFLVSYIDASRGDERLR